MENLNNSFPTYFDNEKYYREDDVIMEERNNISAFNLDFIKYYENLENLQKDLSPQKKNCIDISSIIEQTFCDNLQINEEEFNNEETFLKIGNEGQSPCIDPIQEVNSFEIEGNESFLHENNYLFRDLGEDTNSFDINSTTMPPSDLYRFDNTSSLEESEILRIRKNIMSLRASKVKDMNRSEVLNIQDFGFKKRIFTTVQQNLTNNNISGGNNSLNNCYVSSGIKDNNEKDKYKDKDRDKLNNSCNLSCIYPIKKRGRKKMLFEGIKTEIIDKAFLREFKSYLKKTKILKNIYEELKPDEKSFWNEFLAANSPPFNFTLNGSKVEYKSFSKNLLRHIFSFASVRHLYIQFIKERGKDLVNLIVNKKIKKLDRKTMIFYSFYGTNLHKLYSSDNMGDINLDDFSETMLSTSGLTTFDLVNTSI